MSNATFAMLDQEELQHLAPKASANNDSAGAIGYMKAAVSRADATAAAHYLLGAEYAQIKMYERAIGEMEAAIAIDPTLSVARLQLGMLWLGANEAQRANEVLLPLESLGGSDPFCHFGAGLRHVVSGDSAAALRCLAEGLALNHINAPLNDDMQSIMRKIEVSLAAAGDAGAVAAEASGDGDGQHILLAAYTGQRQ